MNHGSLTIGVRHEPGYVLNPAAGETGIFTAARPREELFTLAGDGRPVIAGLDRVTFLGAAGLGALAGAARRAAPAGPACTWSAPGRRPGSSSGWSAWTAPCGSPAPWPEALQARPAAPGPARPGCTARPGPVRR